MDGIFSSLGDTLSRVVPIGGNLIGDKLKEKDSFMG
jgi:hypothetical protein